MPEKPEDKVASSVPEAGLPGQEPMGPIVVSESAEDDSAGLLNFPVVAIGASAGGLEAYVELLAGLPADAGMAYVLIPHLAPEQKSHMTEILQRHTSIPVGEITDGIKCEQNHIYVLPPNTRVSIDGGKLHLEPRAQGDRAPKPIDHFFRSLADDQKNRAVGIILSGSDSDGSLGLRAIKGEGGVAIVQTPDSARFPDMPRSGIAVDHVDLILPPAHMGRELARLAKQFGAPALRPLEEGQPVPEEERNFAKIVGLLRGVSGLDFRHYKESTIRRRLARRMMLKRVEKPSDYLRYVKDRPEELRNLQEDALINVTRFFRDPPVFDALKNEVLPKLFENRCPDQPVRIWSAGCSTGEEAYSLAIIVLEFMAEHSVEAPIQVFGTDASQDSIEKARVGLYPGSLAADVSRERLRRYFDKVDEGYRVAREVRERCVFARQNLCADPPFSRLDLVSCRNVLIYLTPEIQNVIISTFNYGLNSNGFLLLGASESLRDHGELFSPADRQHKFYRKTSSVPIAPINSFLNGQMLSASSLPQAPAAYAAPSNAPSHGIGTGWAEAELQRATDRMVLALHSPPGVVINDKFEVLQVRGQISPYLRVAPGAPTFHLLRMAHESLAPALREAVETVIKDDLPVRLELSGDQEDKESQSYTVEVLPIHRIRGGTRCFLVLFFSSADSDNAAAFENRMRDEHLIGGAFDENKHEIVQLRRALASSKLQSQSLSEEREIRSHELINAYEELQSANEELQSSNEELQTAKEELQSTNEELQTVNEEMRDRNAELMQASNDLINLFNSANVPLVRLGVDLTIRQITPPAERIMDLRPTDVGRPIREVRLNLKLDEIEPLLNEVLETLSTKEVEVQDRLGKWHFLRIRPYRTTDNKIDGLVLVLVDVDQLRRDAEAIRESRDFAQRVLECVPIPLAVLGEDFRIRNVNAAFRALTKLNAEELERRSFPELAGLLWEVDRSRFRLEGIMRRSDEAVEFEHRDNNGRVFKFEIQVAENGTPTLLVTIEEITGRKELEGRLEEERERLLEEVEATTQVLGRTQEELRSLAAGLFASQEDERRHVARELHDDISQKLALLEIQATEFRKNLPEDLGEIKDQLQTWSGRLGKLSEDVRLLSHGLHPSILDDLGLTPALRQMVHEFGEREGMPATFESVAATEQLSREARTALYRIAQEALRNVSKHAGKTHVRMTLMGIDGGIRLTVRDLGNGFDMGERARSGLGLISMEERARLVSGIIRVESEVNAGTTVEVEVPVASE